MKEFKISKNSITDRSLVMQNYLRDINHISSITPEEEAELARQIRKGGPEAEIAKQKLITANLRFVVSVAKDYSCRGMDVIDLISEGNIGLIKAAESFDETRGFKFISYAVWWIRQSIITAIANSSNTVRMPINQQSVVTQYNRLNQKMQQEEHRDLSYDEFADLVGRDQNKVISTISSSGRAVSVDTPIGDDTDTSMLDMMSSESKTDSLLDVESLKQDLERIMRSCLTDRECIVVRNAYGLGCTPRSLDDVAEMLNMSRERTRQILAKATTKLRDSPFSAILKSYLAS